MFVLQAELVTPRPPLAGETSPNQPSQLPPPPLAYDPYYYPYSDPVYNPYDPYHVSSKYLQVFTSLFVDDPNIIFTPQLQPWPNAQCTGPQGPPGTPGSHGYTGLPGHRVNIQSLC